jgi:ABC-type sugar transport system substrate-binding protein
MYIPITVADPALTEMTELAQHVGDLLGWTVIVGDAKGDPANASALIDQAIRLEVDGVVICAFDLNTMIEPLRDLKAAGIPCVGSWNTPIKGDAASENLYQCETVPLDSCWKDAYNAMAAAYMMSDGHMRIIDLQATSQDCTVDRQTNFGNFVAEAQAAGADVEVLGTYVMPGFDYEALKGGALNLVRSHPDYNVMYASYDAVGMTAIGILQSTGLYEPEKILVSANGKEDFIANIREGGMCKATTALPFVQPWFDFDNLNRYFQGESYYWDAVAYPEEMNLTYLITPDNLPSGPKFVPPWDMEAAFRAMWGV